TNQAITLDTNTTYWGGTPAAPQLQYSSYTDNTALINGLLAGDVQWTWTFIPDWENVYIAQDPEHNHFFTPAAIAGDVLYLNNETKPFDDPVFRKALNMVIDRQAIFDRASSKAFPLVTNVTGIIEPAGSTYIADEFQGQNVAVDVDGAKKLLTDAGYTYKGEELYDPSGARVSFKLSDPAGWTDYIDSLTLIASDAQKLGADATVDGQDQDAWFDNIAKGNFQASLHWTDGGNTPWDLYRSILDGNQYVKQGENANWNFGRYNNQATTDALQTFATSSDPAERDAAIATVEQAYVNDQPAIVVRGRPDSAEYSTLYYTGFPSEDDLYSGPQPTGPQASQILMKLRVNDK
ncbi:MAG: ABC transporter substrate-binding protein, partial [Actinomycetota bacterium]